MTSNLSKFTSYCKNIQPQAQEDIRRFFEGVVGFPYDKELLLQAYVFLNINKLFPLCGELLLFEKPPVGDYTNFGKCDFMYFTAQNTLFLIETKFIDTTATGATERTRRTKHRTKVFEQVIDLRSKFSDFWDIPIEQLECGVFTTDSTLDSHFYANNVVTKSIPIHTLNQWQQNYKYS